MKAHTLCEKINWWQYGSICGRVFARSCRAVHGALGGQEVGATAERSETSLNAIQGDQSASSELGSERYKEPRRRALQKSRATAQRSAANGLSPPFMGLSVGKPECNRERSERKERGSEKAAKKPRRASDIKSRSAGHQGLTVPIYAQEMVTQSFSPQLSWGEELGRSQSLAFDLPVNDMNSTRFLSWSEGAPSGVWEFESEGVLGIKVEVHDNGSSDCYSVDG